MKPGDVVEIEWDDHAFDFGVYTRKGITRAITCGYFVEENQQFIAVALTRNEDGNYSDVQAIDKRMLVRKRKVR